MFFRLRSTQAEYFDLPNRPEDETIAAFRELDRINRKFAFALPFETGLPQLLGARRCARLELLDVGAGTGLLGRQLSSWAQTHGWDWNFTNLDHNPLSLQVGDAPRSVVGSCLQLPFPDASFDVVVASQMTHHLTDAEVAQHLREAWRVTRNGVFICDLHRNAGLYAMLWLTTLIRTDKSVRADALLSVRRAFKLNELRTLASQAGLAKATVRLFYGSRVVIEARKAEV
jgi:ubiquinone/menaquinone biosynthesis C-methylase UbiE